MSQATEQIKALVNASQDIEHETDAPWYGDCARCKVEEAIETLWGKVRAEIDATIESVQTSVAACTEARRSRDREVEAPPPIVSVPAEQ